MFPYDVSISGKSNDHQDPSHLEPMALHTNTYGRTPTPPFWLAMAIIFPIFPPRIYTHLTQFQYVRILLGV